MFGIFLGAACLVGLIVVLSKGRHHRHFAYRGRYSMLGRAFERLDATPGQEKAIRMALDDLWEEGRAVKDEVSQTRGQMAEVIKADFIDQGELERVFNTHDASLNKLRLAFVKALNRVHETLDERQRQRLSELLTSRPWGFHHRMGGAC